MARIDHRVGVRASASDVYRALTIDSELAKWWTTDASGAGETGSVIKFRFNGGGPDFEVTDLGRDVSVRWKFVGGSPDAWNGTEISFQLTEDGKQTWVRFAHTGWKETSDFMAHCSTKWAVFLLSLKDLLETGCGKPFPNDAQIDHT